MMGNGKNKPDKGKTTEQQPLKSLTGVLYFPDIRMLLWGGHDNASDNDAFMHAKNNVSKDYTALSKKNKIRPYTPIDDPITTAKAIVAMVNSQDEGSIRSLDIFGHGSSNGMHFYTGSGIDKTDKQNNYNVSLYPDRVTIHDAAGNWQPLIGPVTWYHLGYESESGLLTQVDFSKFKENVKIELHGCITASGFTPDAVNQANEDKVREMRKGRAQSMGYAVIKRGSTVNDTIGFRDPDMNFAAKWSRMLYQNGKTKAVVIAHPEKVDPLINGKNKTSVIEQDYRHGLRVVYHNGRVVNETWKKRHLDEKQLEGFCR